MMLWNSEYTEHRIREAVSTLARMPATGCFPASDKAAWPDPVQEDYWWIWNTLPDGERQDRLDAYNKTRSGIARGAIGRMDQVIFGLNECFLDRANIILLMARNRERPIPWRILAKGSRYSKSYLHQQVYPRALDLFCDHMRKKEWTKQPDFATNLAKVG